MNDDTIVPEDMLEEFRSGYTRRYSVWVYDKSDVIEVYSESKPSTVEIWFEFDEFSHLYWRMMESQCVDEMHGTRYYNFFRMRRFMMEYMLRDTNFPGVHVRYGSDGKVASDVMERLRRIHPRIWSAVFDKADLFPKSMTEKEEAKLDLECAKLFGSGKGLTNPDKWLTAYVNISSYWEKFGIGYRDLLRMPQEMHVILKKIMNLESSHRANNIGKK